MTSIDKRHRGRAIRKARRASGLGEDAVFVTLYVDYKSFSRSLATVVAQFGRLYTAMNRRPQLIHNGGKP